MVLFKKYNIPQNEYSFNTLINAYTENGDYDKAFETFDEMIAKNYVPNATTINTIMKLHLKLKQPHKAIKAILYIKSMVSKKIHILLIS